MKSIEIMNKVKENVKGYKLPEDFAEGFGFEKEEIINPDVIDEEDLVGFGENLIAYDTTFEHEDTELSLFAIISENADKCMYLLTKGDLNPEELITKGIINL